MLSLFFALVLLYVIWKLQAKHKRKQIQRQYPGAQRLDMSSDHYLLITNVAFVYFSKYLGDTKEILQVDRSRITTYKVGDEEHNRKRKCNASVVLSWAQNNQILKELSFDFDGPESAERCTKFIALIEESLSPRKSV